MTKAIFIIVLALISTVVAFLIGQRLGANDSDCVPFIPAGQAVFLPDGVIFDASARPDFRVCVLHGRHTVCVPLSKVRAVIEMEGR